MNQNKQAQKTHSWRGLLSLTAVLVCLGILAAIQVYAMKDYDAIGDKAARVAGKTYVFQAENDGRSMTLTLERDGSFRYAAIHGDEADTGLGSWTMVGNYVRLYEPDAANRSVNCLSVWDGYLKYSEDKSAGFPTIEIWNGELFYETETGRS